MKQDLPRNIASVKPYSSARDLLNQNIRVFLDANENPFPTALNRYPDPAQRALTSKISDVKKMPKEYILLSNGSDESIDLLFKAFCVPGRDKGLIMTPTYGMYQVRAQVNDVELLHVPLSSDFNPNKTKITQALKDSDLKLILICSPNNPTGNLIDAEWIISLTKSFNGLMVVDEAYIDFSSSEGLRKYCLEVPNLVVLQTLSKAWGMASARLGVTYAAKDIIAILKAIKLPYNISGPLQKDVVARLDKRERFRKNIDSIIRSRNQLFESLKQLEIVEEVYPSEANFILAKFKLADEVYEALVAKGIRIRNFNTTMAGCLRISIGTQKENKLLLQELRNLSS